MVMEASSKEVARKFGRAVTPASGALSPWNGRLQLALRSDHRPSGPWRLPLDRQTQG